MTKMEITKRIEELENRLFLIHMVDRWTNKDRELMAEINRELATLRKKM